MKQAPVKLQFYGGTLELRGMAQDVSWVPPTCQWDERSACFRTQALHYDQVVRALLQAKCPYVDEARRYEVLDLTWQHRPQTRDYQQASVEAWAKARGRGVVVLPTGAGKTHVALLAMLQHPRSTLVVVPTLDLVRQWHGLIEAALGRTVGIVGGGSHEVKDLTVTTYDSAHLHMQNLGNRFGLVVFDECHHLPTTTYAHAAYMCLAPFRLGLTATPERGDGQQQRLDTLIGPVVYRKEIQELSGDFLARYETRRIAVSLSAEERDQYQAARAQYRSFLFRHGIQMSTPQGWSQFIILASRSQEGQRAMDAYRAQRRIALATPAKLAYVEKLLAQHVQDRVLLFTHDNATVYEVSKRFLIPAITHQTKVKERASILKHFKSGELTAIVTSKVLNEGVDVPEANVAIVLSGSGSVREHVQRLGRILRPREGKRALLYELVTEDTSETFTSQRRRDHEAYRR